MSPPPTTRPLKYHSNHIVTCGRCECVILSFLSHRIVGGEKTVWYRCLNCLHTFRCCAGRAIPKHLKTVRGQIYKLQKQLDVLMSVEKKTVERNKADGGIRAMNRDVRRMKQLMIHRVAKEPLIVIEGREVRIRWRDYYVMM